MSSCSVLKLSLEDSAYGSQEESLVASCSDSTHVHGLTRSSSCPQLSVEKVENQLQRTKSLLFPTPSHPPPQPPASSTTVVSSQSLCEDKEQHNEGWLFQVVLEQRVSGVGLLLGRDVCGAVTIKYLVSFGTAAKEGTLR